MAVVALGCEPANVDVVSVVSRVECSHSICVGKVVSAKRKRKLGRKKIEYVEVVKLWHMNKSKQLTITYLEAPSSNWQVGWQIVLPVELVNDPSSHGKQLDAPASRLYLFISQGVQPVEAGLAE